MAEKLLVNVAHEETRVALVEAGRLQNLEIDTARVDTNKGNIYKAVVHRVNASLQAAFVDYGEEKQGFLPVSEIHERYYPAALRGTRPPIKDLLHQGQELMVQIVKDEIGSKGAALTTNLSLAGRYLVLMADSEKETVSRRMPRDERTRLKKIVSGLDVPEGFGVIVRTAGLGREEEDLRLDLSYLTKLWENLQDRFKKTRGADLIHIERSIALRFIRDYATHNIDEIIVDDKASHTEIRNFCTVLAPDLVNRVTLYKDARPLFSRYQVEDQIDDIFARKIDLPSGGSIVIDQTEALVAIDVNSGRVKTDDIEQTALTTNLEAAAEIARQLKIRDRGGLIVADFIDMRERGNIKKVEQAVTDSFANDKAKVKFSRISEFGLMEISRQRLQSSLMKGSFTPCPHCSGSGQIRSVESSSLYILRRIKEFVIRGSYMHLKAQMSVELANYILNKKRRDLLELEAESGTSLQIEGDKRVAPMEAFIEMTTRPSGKSKRPRRILQRVDLVRSETNKSELDVDEPVDIEMKEWRATTDGLAQRHAIEQVNRDLEAELAKEREVLTAQHEADASLRKQQEDEARAKAAAAELELLKEKERIRREGMSFFGRIRTFFTGQSVEEEVQAYIAEREALGAPPVVEAPKPEVRAEQPRAQRNDNQRSNDRRGGGRRDNRAGDGRRSDGRRNDGGRKRNNGRSRDDGKQGDSRKQNDGRKGDGRNKQGDGRNKQGDGRNKQGDDRNKQGDGRNKQGDGRNNQGDGRKDGRSGRDEAAKREERKDAPKDGAVKHEGGEGDSSGKKRRRRRKRGGANRNNGGQNGDNKPNSDGVAAKSSDGGNSKSEGGRKPAATKGDEVKAGGTKPAAKASEKKAADKLPRAGGVIDLRGGGVVDLRGGGGKKPSSPKLVETKAASKTAKPKSDAAKAVKAKAEPKAKTEPKAKAAPKAATAAAAKAKPAAEAKAKAPAKAKAKAPAAKAKAEAKANAEPKPKAKASAAKAPAASAKASAAKKPAAKKTTAAKAKAVAKKSTGAAAKKAAPAKKAAAKKSPAKKAATNGKTAAKKAAATDKTAAASAASVSERLAALKAKHTTAAKE